MTPKELLLKIKKHILEEPLRMNMYEGLILDVNAFIQRRNDKEDYIPSGRPPCNTVGCIAGWCCILGGAVDPAEEESAMVAWGDVRDKAEDLLKLPWDSSGSRGLFYEQDWPRDLYLKLSEHKAGTREYAEVVAERIDQFIVEQNW